VTLMEKENIYRVLVAKPEGKRTLGRLRRWWEDNIASYLKDIEMGKEGAWNGFIWLRIRASGGLVSTREWTFEFHEGEYREYVSTYPFLKTAPAPRSYRHFTSHLILMLCHYSKA
jgi:hypothetical protein